MSTLTGKPNLTLIRSPEELRGYFAGFCKKPEQRKIGLEAEFFGVDAETGQALHFSGVCGLESILTRFAKRFSYELIQDQGAVIGAKYSDGTMVGFEPGGQLELSAPPVKTIFEVEKHLQNFFEHLRTFRCECQEVHWLSVGIHPVSRLDEIGWIPKTRYKILSDFASTRGKLSHHMMKRTATNQMNFDYTSEADAMEMMRVAFSITSIASALFANSSFSEGKPSGFLSERLNIWMHTTPERSGLLVGFAREGKTFQNFLDYVLDVPMIFVVRDSKWIPMNGLPFRHFIKNGYEGLSATLSDFELHLSTLFPEVRFKQYMEIRGMDAQRSHDIPGVAAFWKGILYDQKAREESWKLTGSFTSEERLRLHADVSTEGLQAQVKGKPILPLAESLVQIAKEGLKRQISDKDKDESSFLKPIEERLKSPQKTPAEILLHAWETHLQKNRGQLIDFLSI